MEHPTDAEPAALALATASQQIAAVNGNFVFMVSSMQLSKLGTSKFQGRFRSAVAWLLPHLSTGATRLISHVRNPDLLWDFYDLDQIE